MVASGPTMIWLGINLPVVSKYFIKITKNMLYNESPESFAFIFPYGLLKLTDAINNANKHFKHCFFFLVWTKC